jgi:rhodanese-related sulfurtransferase/DNA-binding transcriptional ArsR family regulator
MDMLLAREAKDRLFSQYAKIGAAISSPKRLELLDLLCQCEKTVETLAEQSAMSIANTSRHLQSLRQSRLVDCRKSGRHVLYRLADDEVCEFVRNVRQLAEKRIAEIDRIVADYFTAPTLFQPVNRRDLIRRAKTGEVVILDVRPSDEYLAGHLPYAVSVPLRELKSFLKSLPPKKEIIAYCRGPYCVLAQEAVTFLRAKGFDAVRLTDGVAEWRDAGLPVEMTRTPFK